MFIIRNGEINSDKPTTAPKPEAAALSPGVASPSLARSDASPAPAPTANAPAKGNPTTGIAAAPRIPPKDPRASPNLRGIPIAP